MGKDGRGRKGGTPCSRASRLGCFPTSPRTGFPHLLPCPWDFLNRCTARRSPLCNTPKGTQVRTCGLTLWVGGRPLVPVSTKAEREFIRELRRQDRRGPLWGGREVKGRPRLPESCLPLSAGVFGNPAHVLSPRAALLPGVSLPRLPAPGPPPWRAGSIPRRPGREPAPGPHPPPTPPWQPLKPRGAHVEQCFLLKPRAGAARCQELKVLNLQRSFELRVRDPVRSRGQPASWSPRGRSC